MRVAAIFFLLLFCLSAAAAAKTSFIYPDQKEDEDGDVGVRGGPEEQKEDEAGHSNAGEGGSHGDEREKSEHGVPVPTRKSCEEGEGGEGHGEKHGSVRLVSWRWDMYRNTILFTFMILLACLLKVGFHHVPSLAHHFPESCLLIIVGLITGAIVHFAYELDDCHFPAFTNDLFFNVLLPPIILDAAYSIYDEDFFLNLNSILIFAVVGTLFNIFAIGGSLYVIYNCGAMGDISGVTLVQFLVFASVISAVDPVAVLAIFDEIGVNMVLYFLVFGESLLNDGVSVVVYNTMITLNSQEHITPDQYLLAIVSFFTVVLGGILIGTVVAILTALILRLTSRARVLEPLIIILMAYFAYIGAELVHWSGIISLVACGVLQRRYALANASKKTYTTVKYGVKTLSSTSDCIIFIFLGKVAANKFDQLEFNLSFIVCTLGLITIVRFVGVGLLSNLINTRRTTPISFKEQFIMAYGGLRGAVGFSLIYVLYESDPSPVNKVFLTTTLIVVFFTVFIQGGTIKFMVNKLKITRKGERDKSHIILDVNKKTTEHVMAGVESITGHRTIGTYFKIIEAFDNLYVKKVLLSRKAQDRMTLRLQKITLDEHYARLYGPAVLAARRDPAGAVEPAKVAFDAKSDSVQIRVKGPLQDDDDDGSLLPSYRASLHMAFMNNSYEKHRNRLTRGDAEESYMTQLDNRQRQARNIERRLLMSAGDADDIIMEEEDSGASGGDDDVMMRPKARSRTRSSVTPREVRRQYLEAKKKFKSVQFHQ